ncbi:SAM-dependent methyltransferase [Nocardia sp. NPDC059246]|uniref:SAM-dependent methyltransferase n=1 Tax=unclassified Nocardia TaxID=2637762 RepID=UPI0036C1CC18
MGADPGRVRAVNPEPYPPPVTAARLSRTALDHVDVCHPQYPRIHNYLLGGKDNYEVDRAFVTSLALAFPAIKTAAWASRRFLLDIVDNLARQGLNQFWELGAGMPFPWSVDQAAQQVNPNARVLYVDRDAVTAAHYRATAETDHVRFLHADVRETEQLIAAAHEMDLDIVGTVLRFTEPIVVSCCGLLELIADPAPILRTLAASLPPGSFVVTTHLVTDAAGEQSRALVDAHACGRLEFHPRSADEVRALFDGCGHITYDEMLTSPITGTFEPHSLALVVECGGLTAGRTP